MEKCAIYCNITVPANNKPSGIVQPGKSSFNLPAAFVTAKLPAIVISLLFIVVPVRADQLDTPVSKTLTKGVTVIALIGNQPQEVVLRYNDTVQRLLEERDLTRGRRRKVVPQRNSLAVDHHHPLRALPPLGFPDGYTPFFAGAKLPSTKASLQSSCFLSSSSETNALHASIHTSCSSQSFNLRQQVEGLGYSFGKSAQGAPVLSTHRIPSKTLRLSAQGRPPFLLRLGFGRSFSSFFHCSSVNSIRFLAIGRTLLSMTKFTLYYLFIQSPTQRISRL